MTTILLKHYVYHCGDLTLLMGVLDKDRSSGSPRWRCSGRIYNTATKEVLAQANDHISIPAFKDCGPLELAQRVFDLLTAFRGALDEYEIGEEIEAESRVGKGFLEHNPLTPAQSGFTRSEEIYRLCRSEERRGGEDFCLLEEAA